MVKTALNITGGFDTAVLTHKLRGEAQPDKASPFSESVLKDGLFIISKVERNEIPLQDTVIDNLAKKVKRTNNRKRIIFDDTFLHNGKTYQVNSAKSGLYVEVLTRIIEQFEITLAKWNRVFVLRFDLHTHRFTNDNKLMTGFRKRLFQKLKREYEFKDIGFCWVREQERAKTQHYHWVLFVDGRLIRHSSRINQMVKDAWEDLTGTFTVWHVKRPFYLVDSDDIMREAIYRLSYLAKPRGKGYRPPQTKDFQCSRMK